MVIGILSAAMIDWIIDDTFKPLKVPPMVTLIKPVGTQSIGMKEKSLSENPSQNGA